MGDTRYLNASIMSILWSLLISLKRWITFTLLQSIVVMAISKKRSLIRKCQS